jgi:hypothetical protein
MVWGRCFLRDHGSFLNPGSRVHCHHIVGHSCRHNNDNDAANDSGADHCGADIAGDDGSSVTCGMWLVQCVLG